MRPTPQPWTMICYFLETIWLDESFYIHPWVQTWTKTTKLQFRFHRMFVFLHPSGDLFLVQTTLVFHCYLFCFVLLFYFIQAWLQKIYLTLSRFAIVCSSSPFLVQHVPLVSTTVCVWIFRTSHVVFCILQTFMYCMSPSSNIYFCYTNINILLVCSSWEFGPFVNKILTNLI